MAPTPEKGCAQTRQNGFVFECPVCGRQTITPPGEAPPKPYVCDGLAESHRVVEMEQKMRSAFRTELQ